MSCERASPDERVEAYAAGRLEEAAAAAFEDHYFACAACSSSAAAPAQSRAW